MVDFSSIGRNVELDMKLHNYVDQLLGSKIAISVLRTLIKYKAKIYTIRGLAEDAGASHPEVSKTLEDLAKFGIVKIQSVGKAYQISLNEKSYVLDKVIEPLFEAEQNTLDEVISILKRHLNNKSIISALIFGSVARKEEKQGSDIDLLIISNDHDRAIEIIANVTEEISMMFATRVSHIIFSEKQLREKRKSDLVRSIIKDHILVSGKELGISK